MIKIVIQESFLKEELKYSQSALSDMFSFYKSAGSEGKKIKNIMVPFRDLYIKGPTETGIVLYRIFNIQGNEKFPENLKHHWDVKSNRFNKDFVDRSINSSFPIQLIINRSLNDRGQSKSFWYKGTDGNLRTSMAIEINPEFHQDDEDIKTTLKHELQHVTTVMNSVCLEYSLDLKKAGGDLDKLSKKRLTVRSVKTLVGTGKGKIGLTQATNTSVSNLTQKQIDDLYYADDREFEPWTNDLCQKFVEWATAKNLIKLDISNHDQAVNLVSMLIRDQKIQNEFGSGISSSYLKFFKKAMEVRPREFPSRMIREIRNILNQQTKS